METPTPAFEGWAIVEQMGHKTVAGYVREVQLAGVPLLRIDVPGPDGSDGDPVATQFIHASTLYALTPTAEAIVRKVAVRTRVEPAATWGVSADRTLGPGRDHEEDLGPIEDDEQPDEIVDELLVNHGLAGVLELLIQNYEPTGNNDLSEPDAERYIAILEEAKRLVDEDGRWPDSTARADKADQRQQEDVEEALAAGEERPPALVAFETTGDASGLEAAAAAGDTNDDDMPF